MTEEMEKEKKEKDQSERGQSSEERAEIALAARWASRIDLPLE